MQPLAIKCYLPGRRTQYALYPSEDMSIELGGGADLCPRGFDDDVRVRFRLIDGQWFVSPLLGKVSDRDGALIEGQTALTLPAMLSAGSATLVLDSTVDPRMPARVIQVTPDSARALRAAPGPAPVARLSAVPRQPARVQSVTGRAPRSELGAASAAARAPQPQGAPWQPPVAGGERAPALAARVQPSVVVQQAEEPAIRELNETRILDMTQLGVQPPGATPAPAVIAPGPAAAASVASRALIWVRANPRQLAYAVLFLGLVTLHFGAQWRTRALAAARAAATAVRPAASDAPRVGALPQTRPASKLLPLAPGEEPSPRRAGELFAIGDYPNALRQYLALAEGPEAEPVFGVIAHSLEQRLRHPQVKR